MSEPKQEKTLPASHAPQKTLPVSDPGAVLPLPTAPIVHTPIDRPVNSTFNSEFDLRLLGTDMVSYDERCDAILSKSALKSHLTRFTPNSGCNLRRLENYAICQTQLRNEPAKVLFMSLPGFGTEHGGRHSCSILRNLSQLALTHLETPGHDIVIDGASGNPAWYHEGLSSLRSHPKWTEPKSYFWCDFNGKAI